MLLISVIIPVYNAKTYIQRCIESIKYQSFNDWELILIDDGSTDNSYEICKKYEDSKIHVFHKENGGVSSARNYGLSVAKGKHIVFVDADDYVDKDYLRNFYDNIANSDLVISGYKEVYTSGKVKIKDFGCKKLTIEDLKKEFDELYLSNLFNSPFNKLYKRELIEFKFNEQQSLGEDLLFNLEYIKKCKSINVISNTDYNYIINSMSATNKYNYKSIENYLIVKKELEKMCKTMQTIQNKSIERVFEKNVCGSIQLLLENKSLNYKDKIIELKRIKMIVEQETSLVANKSYFSSLQKIITYCLRKEQYLLLYLFIKVRLYIKSTYSTILKGVNK